MGNKRDKSTHNIEPVAKCDQSLVPVRIESLIYIIRDQQVMLASDLARLYGVETKVLNQAVKRNIQRFPEDFMFQLTKEECLRSQIVTLNEARGHHLKYLPNAFTENGVAMLSSVLRSDKAIEVNINIMRAFSAMRNFLINNAAIFQRMDQLEMKQLKTDEKVDAILDKLGDSDKPKEGVFFNGQIFDAYALVAELIRQAKKRIDEDVYHIGASLKDLGKKLFAFSKMEVMTGSDLIASL